VIRVPASLAPATQADVATADFHSYEAGGTGDLPAGVRIFGGREAAGTGIPERPVSENLEPEYATVSADSATAWVTLQEANALAEVDLASATVVAIRDLGVVDRMAVPFDASDDDGAIAIRSWPVLAFPMPDAVDSYEVDGATYLVTANEGDSRDWSGYSEVSRVADLAAEGPGPVCGDAFDASGVPADPTALLADDALGRLNVTTANGFDEERGCFSRLYTFGSRSMSIWSASGERVWDSGEAFERIVAEAAPDYFNSSHTESGSDGRSDDKGPEPEGLVLGEVDGRTYAFVGFERVGGVAVYDVTRPTEASFVTYLNNRDFSVSAEDDGLEGAGDLGPEGLTFIPAGDSPTGGALLAVGNEVSGSTTLYAVEPTEQAAPFAVSTPTDGATLDSRAVTFTGTGSVGATVSATLADGTALGGPVETAADGTWTLGAVFGEEADARQTVLVRQTDADGALSEVGVRLILPAAAPAPAPTTPGTPAPTTPAPTGPGEVDPAPSGPESPQESNGSDDAADADELAYTGADASAGTAAGIAALLMLGGAALVLDRRRRRSA
jgi:LPXTG-motif cell wall-anchored protein